MSEWTKEPWGISSESPRIIKKFDFLGESRVIIASVSGGETSGPCFPESSAEVEANARRIVACVNACAGISTENLEQNQSVAWLAQQYNGVLKQRDQLLAALIRLHAVARVERDEDYAAIANAAAAIAAVEGK